MKKYDSYKNSGIEWLGKIPEHWQKKKLKYVINYKKGKNPSSFSTKKTKNIYLSMEYLRNKTTSKMYIKNTNGLVKVSEDDILLLWDGANAGEFLKSKNGFLSSTMAVLKINIYSKIFTFYYLKFLEKELKKLTIGMGIPHVNSKILNNLIILLPPKEEQQKIASFLDEKISKIDKLIKQKEKLIKLLKERKEVIINDTVTKGLNKNAKMKNSGIEWLGEIPEHWKIVRLGSVFLERIEKVSDKHFQPLSVTKKGIVPQLETAAKTNDGDNRKLVKKGDFVINSRSDRKGSSGLSELEGSVSLINIVLKPIKINSKFSHYLFKSNGFIEEFYRNGHGIVADLWTTRFWDMKFILLPLPPLNEQKEIVKYIENEVSKIDKAIEVEENYIKKLKEYKEVLIDNAVTGKIKVF